MTGHPRLDAAITLLMLAGYMVALAVIGVYALSGALRLRERIARRRKRR